MDWSLKTSYDLSKIFLRALGLPFRKPQSAIISTVLTLHNGLANVGSKNMTNTASVNTKYKQCCIYYTNLERTQHPWLSGKWPDFPPRLAPPNPEDPKTPPA